MSQRTIDGIEVDKHGFAVTPRVQPEKEKRKKGDPRVVFTGEALEDFEKLPPEIQEQVLAATNRISDSQLIATVPVTRAARKNIMLVGVAPMPDGNDFKWNAVVPIDLELRRGDVLEIRVKRGEE